jgi:hypothetical protein
MCLNLRYLPQPPVCRGDSHRLEIQRTPALRYSYDVAEDAQSSPDNSKGYDIDNQKHI